MAFNRLATRVASGIRLMRKFFDIATKNSRNIEEDKIRLIWLSRHL